MALFVGLTDDPHRQRHIHGYPKDWQVFGPFGNQAQAREWKREQLMSPALQTGPDTGWRFGYLYTVTPHTRP